MPLTCLKNLFFNQPKIYFLAVVTIVLIVFTPLGYAQDLDGLVPTGSLTAANVDPHSAVVPAQGGLPLVAGIPGLPAFAMTPRSDGGQDYTVTIQVA